MWLQHRPYVSNPAHQPEGRLDWEREREQAAVQLNQKLSGETFPPLIPSSFHPLWMEDGKRDGNTNWWSKVLPSRLCFSFVTWVEPPREDAVGEKKKKEEARGETGSRGRKWGGAWRNGLNELSD